MNGISLTCIIRAARARVLVLPAELAGYLLLGIVDGLANRSGTAAPDQIELLADGRIALRRVAGADREQSDSWLRGLLAELLSVAVAPTPALMRASQVPERAKVPAFATDLQAALIPVNRSAARRALARLGRELSKVDLPLPEVIQPMASAFDLDDEKPEGAELPPAVSILTAKPVAPLTETIPDLEIRGSRPLAPKPGPELELDWPTDPGLAKPLGAKRPSVGPMAHEAGGELSKPVLALANCGGPEDNARLANASSAGTPCVEGNAGLVIRSSASAPRIEDPTSRATLGAAAEPRAFAERGCLGSGAAVAGQSAGESEIELPNASAPQTLEHSMLSAASVEAHEVSCANPLQPESAPESDPVVERTLALCRVTPRLERTQPLAIVTQEPGHTLPIVIPSPFLERLSDGIECTMPLPLVRRRVASEAPHADEPITWASTSVEAVVEIADDEIVYEDLPADAPLLDVDGAGSDAPVVENSTLFEQEERGRLDPWIGVETASTREALASRAEAAEPCTRAPVQWVEPQPARVACDSPIQVEVEPAGKDEPGAVLELKGCKRDIGTIAEISEACAFEGELGSHCEVVDVEVPETSGRPEREAGLLGTASSCDDGGSPSAYCGARFGCEIDQGKSRRDTLYRSDPPEAGRPCSSVESLSGQFQDHALWSQGELCRDLRLVAGLEPSSVPPNALTHTPPPTVDTLPQESPAQQEPTRRLRRIGGFAVALAALGAFYSFHFPETSAAPASQLPADTLGQICRATVTVVGVEPGQGLRLRQSGDLRFREPSQVLESSVRFVGLRCAEQAELLVVGRPNSALRKIPISGDRLTPHGVRQLASVEFELGGV